jgi:hypothetical protein
LAPAHIEGHCEKKHQSRCNAFEVAGQAEQVEAVFEACNHDRPKVRAQRNYCREEAVGCKDLDKFAGRGGACPAFSGHPSCGI